MRTPEEIKEYQKTWREKNRKKMRKYAQKYRDAHRDVPQHLFRKYGITVQDKQRMWKEQNGKCKVCGEPMKDVFDRDCCVDHCHVTKQVRGLIHWYCNIIVGVVENKPVLFCQVKDYIDSYKRDAIVRTHENNNHESVAEMSIPCESK